MPRTRAVVDLVNLVAVSSGAIVAAAYIVSPDLRRWVEVNVTNRAAWYYLGKYVQRPDDPDLAPGSWEGAADGCEQPERTFYHVSWDENRPFDESVIDTLPGQIMVSLNPAPTMGRTGDIDDPRFSDNPVIAVAPFGECFFVRQTARRPIGDRPGCDGVERPSVAYWAELTRITCN